MANVLLAAGSETIEEFSIEITANVAGTMTSIHAGLGIAVFDKSWSLSGGVMFDDFHILDNN